MAAEPATPAELEAERVSAPLRPLQSSGKFDPARRRRSKRAGRERGCWLYMAATELARAGYTSADPPPYFRVWGGERGRYIVTLYREP